MSNESLSLPGYRQQVIIANGASVSSVVDLRGISPRGLRVTLPEAWTAADIGIQVSEYVLAANEDTGDIPEESWELVCTSDASVRALITNIPTSMIVLQTCLVPAAGWVAANYYWLRLESVSTVDSFDGVNQGAPRLLTVGLLR
jgi:hypothetical protein